MTVRTCLHRIYVRIFEHNLAENKAKICSNMRIFQEFLTQLSAEFAEKTCIYAYVDKFLNEALKAAPHNITDKRCLYGNSKKTYFKERKNHILHSMLRRL